MASYRPFPPPPQSTFVAPPPPNQNPLPPPPPPTQSRGGSIQYSQNWGDGSSFQQGYPNQASFQQTHYGGPSRNSGNLAAPLPPPPVQQQQQQQQQYPYPPPPPLESSYPPPPPPSLALVPPQPQLYYPSSQYTQFNNQPLQPLQQPPPPPSSPPPPPPPSSPPPPPPSHSKESKVASDRGVKTEGPLNHGLPSKQHKPSIPVGPGKRSNVPSGRVETEEERRLRKKREFEKQRQEDKHRPQLKESQNKVLQKTQMLSSGTKVPGSITGGSHMGDRRATPFLSADQFENRLKKPTTFICKLKFRNELPDPTEQRKLLLNLRDKDRIAKYRITALEKLHKPQLYVDSDLGIPLDLLDLSVYNPPKGDIMCLDPEDAVLLRDDDPVTPIKKDGIKRKDRPTDQGVSWLVKTQYISPLSMDSAKQSLTEKQAKELRDKRRGRGILDNTNNRERKIQEIQSSFEACKTQPVHATNKKLQPVEVMPLFPDFDRDDDQFVIANFDSAPTADTEMYQKLESSVRDAHESQAIMKSFVVTASDNGKQDKFLAYMVPSVDELSKDMYDEHEDISFTWVREYHWDVRGEDADDPTTYLVAFGDTAAHYVPLATKLVLRKKRAREGKSMDEIEHYPAPSTVTVRRRSKVSAVELEDSRSHLDARGSASAFKRQRVYNGSPSRQQKVIHHERDDSSGAEYDLSD